VAKTKKFKPTLLDVGAMASALALAGCNTSAGNAPAAGGSSKVTSPAVIAAAKAQLVKDPAGLSTYGSRLRADHRLQVNLQKGVGRQLSRPPPVDVASSLTR
jgi:hypothetical protein